MEFSRLAVRHGLCTYVSTAIRAGYKGFGNISSLLDTALEGSNSINPDDVDMTDMTDMLTLLLNTTTVLSDELWSLYIQNLSLIIKLTMDHDIAMRQKRILSLILPYVHNINPPHFTDVSWGTLFSGVVTSGAVPQNVANVRVEMVAELLAHGADPIALYKPDRTDSRL
ncbi:hypothetical protein B7463_g4059, partial [Scytalidium lignicola]